jgi:membrane fusion protein (multidrug efflux system)
MNNEMVMLNTKTNTIRPVELNRTGDATVGDLPAVANEQPRTNAAHAHAKAPRHGHHVQPVRRSRWKRVAVAAAAVALTIGAAGFGLRQVGWGAPGVETTDDAYVDGHVVAAAPQVAGRVLEVLVDDNQHVEAGQVLARIDPADYQVKLEQALAARAQAQGQLTQARAQLPVTQSAAAQAAAQVKVAEANAGKAADDLRRYRQLSGDAISKITLNAAQTQQATTAAQLDAARQAAGGEAAKVELAKAAIGTAEANLKAADAAVAQARLNLSYCEVKADLPGFVTRKTVERGNYVQVGQPMMNLVPQRVYVTANFKETQLAHMRAGQAVTFTVDAYPRRTFRGRVDSVMNGTGSAFALLPPENATGNFVKVVQRVPVKIVLDGANDDAMHRLAPGMSVVPAVRVAEEGTKAVELAEGSLR